MSKSASSHDNSYQGYDRPGPPPTHAGKGLIVDTYVRHHQDWIVPRRVMCAFFWTGIILLFTGIILLVTSKHKEGAYQSWGAVLLGLGFCLLLICMILCMHAYCVITVNDEEPPMVTTVPPPPPSVLTLANGHKPKDSNTGSDITTHSAPSLQRGVSYGSMQYSESPEGVSTLKSLPEKQHGHSDMTPQQHSEIITEKLKDILEKSDRLNEMLGKGSSESGQSTPVTLASNGEKKTLSQVGKLPSYNTAIKMAPYCPEKRRSHSTDSDVEIGYLKDDLKSTLERKKSGLRKSVTFDDSTGDVRVEFNPAGVDADLDLHLDQIHKSPGGSPAFSRPSLGSPPYDNEVDFYLPPSHPLSTIPESPSSQSEGSVVAFTTTTWSHIAPQTHVPLLSVALPPSTSDVISVSCDNRHEPHDFSSAPPTVTSSTVPQRPHVLSDNAQQPLQYSQRPHTGHENIMNELRIIEDSDVLILEIDEELSSGRILSSMPEHNSHKYPILAKDQTPYTVSSKRKQPDLSVHLADKDEDVTNGATVLTQRHMPEPPFLQGHHHLHAISEEPPAIIEGQGHHSPRGADSLAPTTGEGAAAAASGAVGGQQQQPEEAPVQLRRPLTVQVSDADSTASSKLSVYDNVQYVWKPKSGSELKHYHF